jgi:hypothetical protein
MLPSCSDDHWNERDEFFWGYEKLTGQSSEQIAPMFEAVDESTTDFAPMLKLPTPKVSLTEFLD